MVSNGGAQAQGIGVNPIPQLSRGERDYGQATAYSLIGQVAKICGNGKRYPIAWGFREKSPPLVWPELQEWV